MAQNQNVNVWRATHILLYTCTIGTSLGALLSYRNMNSSLETTMSKCMLYTQPWVELNVKTGNCRIDLARTEWGGDGLCNFVLFSMLASFVYGVISVWFFIMCAPSRNLPEDDSFVHVWKIVPPATALSTILALLTLIMAWLVTSGVNTFFYELELRVLRNCTTRAGGPAAWENDSVATLYNERLTTQIFVWLIVLCWVMAALSLVCRCLTAADFGGGGVSVHPGGELISYLGGFLSSLYRNRREPAAATARVTARQRPTLEQQRQV
ncbi:hypothetical protein HPB51_000647 [Rhipicephalus microplus]|uniref:Uncharacterized protein n=1 Tax=Rhipicephalus microplus TaxID=6941 RepID=A0A9J6E4J3_RHIMP|nr:uncharacterized protein LOC119165324 [Rhipicephalus microplus]KAH8029475.1 hypothetical protein HPB51_000647 [Rhipicephalus microplus]